MAQQVVRWGALYDSVSGWPSEHDLVHVFQWIEVEVEAGSVRILEHMQAPRQYANLVVAVAPGRLAQIEFMFTVDDDVALRMHEYRSWLMRTRPGNTLTQHVLVLGPGELANVHGDAEHWFRIHAVHLCDCDPRDLLRSPSLAPLAPLARAGSDGHRTQILRDALRVIGRDEADHERRAVLADVAESMARLHLDRGAIDAARQSAQPRRVSELTEETRQRLAVEAVLRQRFGDRPFTSYREDSGS